MNNIVEIIGAAIQGLFLGSIAGCVWAMTGFISDIKNELKQSNRLKEKQVDLMQARWNADKRKDHDIAAMTSTLMQTLDNISSSGPIDDDDE